MNHGLARLSVIIPVYKAERTLDRCMESVLAQDVAGMEVILVDDGSPDGCPQICDAWAQKDARVSVIHKPNGGTSDARNAGIGRARGEYITFVDNDDYIAGGSYDCCLSFMDEHPEVDILEYPALLHIGAGRRECPLTFDRQIYPCDTLVEKQEIWIEHGLFGHCFMWNKIFRKHLFDDTLFTRGEMFEDIFIMPELLLQAKVYATIDCGRYLYVDNPAGISRSNIGVNNEYLIKSQLRGLKLLGIDINSRQADRCMASLVNTQIDMWRYSRQCPSQLLVPQRWIGLSVADNAQMFLKLLMQNILGLRTLCKIYRAFS